MIRDAMYASTYAPMDAPMDVPVGLRMDVPIEVGIPIEGQSRSRERGFLAVEVVALLPLVLFVILMTAQLLLWGLTSIAASAAAREAAVAIEQGRSARRAAAGTLPAAWECGVGVKVDGAGVLVEIRVPQLLVGGLSPTVRARAVPGPGVMPP